MAAGPNGGIVAGEDIDREPSVLGKRRRIVLVKAELAKKVRVGRVDSGHVMVHLRVVEIHAVRGLHTTFATGCGTNRIILKEVLETVLDILREIT